MQERSTYLRMAVALLALIGFFDAAYLMISRFETDVSMVCPITGDGCNAVRDSPWSVIPPGGSGIPVALIGMVGFVLLFVLAMVALHRERLGALSLPPALAVLSSCGILFSIYLVTVQALVIRTFCSWCLLASVLMLSIWITALYDWRMWRGDGAAKAETEQIARSTPRTRKGKTRRVH